MTRSSPDWIDATPTRLAWDSTGSKLRNAVGEFPSWHPVVQLTVQIAWIAEYAGARAHDPMYALQTEAAGPGHDKAPAVVSPSAVMVLSPEVSVPVLVTSEPGSSTDGVHATTMVAHVADRRQQTLATASELSMHDRARQPRSRTSHTSLSKECPNMSRQRATRNAGSNGSQVNQLIEAAERLTGQLSLYKGRTLHRGKQNHEASKSTGEP